MFECVILLNEFRLNPILGVDARIRRAKFTLIQYKSHDTAWLFRL